MVEGFAPFFRNSRRRIDVNQCYCEGIDYALVDPLIFSPLPILKSGLFSEVP